MERKKRTYTHKGKIRYKRRLPRKVKKALKKNFVLEYNTYKLKLINLHGENWLDFL